MNASPTSGRPAADEYAPYYARYVARVPDGDPCALLAAQVAETRRLFEAVGETRAGEPYAPGKWSVKDMLQHVTDTERIMAYRALRIARADATPLPGYEQDDYVRTAGANGRTLRVLLDELVAVRAATVALFAGLDAAALARRGTASGQPVSARGLLYIVLGHELHHAQLLREHFPELAGAASATPATA